MRLQIASDLHLESRPKMTFKEILEPAAPALALLGDVAPLADPNLRAFMEWCSENWETVIWIPGQAELLGPGSGNEGRRIPDLVAPVAKMRRLVEPFWNITILDHEALRTIYNRDLAWIRSKARAQKEPVLILSHYGPTTWLQEEGFVGDPDKSVVFPDIEEILRAPVVAWLCGHVHQSVQYTKEWHDATGAKGSVLIATNPKGLPMQNLEYRPDAVVRLDPSLFSL